MLGLDQSAKFVLSEDILLKAFPETDQYFAFDTKNGDHYNLNVTAHWVLEKLAYHYNFGLLVKDFTVEFGLKEEDALKDLAQLIEFAIESKIIIRRVNNEE